MLRLSHYSLRWKQIFNLTHRVTARSIVTSCRSAGEKKAPISGQPSPVNLDTFKSEGVAWDKATEADHSEQFSGQAAVKKEPDYSKPISAVALLALVIIVFKWILYPVYIDTGSSQQKKNRGTEAFVRTQEIIFEYNQEKTKEEYIRDQLQQRNISNPAIDPEKAIPDIRWREAAQIVNPLKNFAEEKARVESQPEDPRSLEEIKASIAALRQKS